MTKSFVKVLAEHNESGDIRPIRLTWVDGRTYGIDKVLDIRQAPSLKAGGLGIRYTCRIRGKQVYLFCDEGKWFIEHS